MVSHAATAPNAPASSALWQPAPMRKNAKAIRTRNETRLSIQSAISASWAMTASLSVAARLLVDATYEERRIRSALYFASLPIPAKSCVDVRLKIMKSRCRGEGVKLDWIRVFFSSAIGRRCVGVHYLDCRKKFKKVF